MRKAIGTMMALAVAATAGMAQEPANRVANPAGTNGVQTSNGGARGAVAGEPRGAVAGQARGAVNDALFVAAAASAGMAELGTARLAVERAGCDEIKTFAQRMIVDHTKANRELMALAAQRRLTVPTTISIGDQAAANALSGVTGEEFDRAYAKDQMAAHICAVNLFTAEAERGTDPEIRAWAAKMLPTLKEHKKMINRTCEMHEKKDAEQEKSSGQ